jgi:hypothetical protein
MERAYRIKRAMWWVGVVVALGYLLVVIPLIAWRQDLTKMDIIAEIVFWLIVLAVLAVLGRINERHGFLRAPHNDG